MTDGEALKVVGPLTSYEISQFAAQVRSVFDLKPDTPVKMAEFLELVFQHVLPDCHIEVEPDEEMPGVDGATLIGSPVIKFRATTYDDLRREDPEARFTAAHEIGHALLHSTRPLYHASRSAYVKETDPEWQADQFAAAFLMPEAAFRRCGTAGEAMQLFKCADHHVRDRATALNHRFGGIQLELNLFPLSTKKEERDHSRPS